MSNANIIIDIEQLPKRPAPYEPQRGDYGQDCRGRSYYWHRSLITHPNYYPCPDCGRPLVYFRRPKVARTCDQISGDGIRVFAPQSEWSGAWGWITP